MERHYGAIFTQQFADWLSEKPSVFHTRTRREIFTPGETAIAREAFAAAWNEGHRYAIAHPQETA